MKTGRNKPIIEVQKGIHNRIAIFSEFGDTGSDGRCFLSKLMLKTIPTKNPTPAPNSLILYFDIIVMNGFFFEIRERLTKPSTVPVIFYNYKFIIIEVKRPI